MAAKVLVRQFLGRRGYRIRRTYRPLIEHPDAGLTPTIDMLLHYVQALASPVTFAEIGAFDGAQGDPMWSHIRSGRWQGVVVEPQRGAYEQLCRNYADQEQVTAICAAVGKTGGTATLYKAADGSPASLDWTHQQASLKKEQVLRLQKHLPELEAGLFEEEVDIITFSDALRTAGLERVDVIQIDTEGMDWEILQSVDLVATRPKLIIYEHKHLSWDDREAALSHLIEHGYRVGEVSPRDTAAVAEELLTGGG